MIEITNLESTYSEKMSRLGDLINKTVEESPEGRAGMTWEAWVELYKHEYGEDLSPFDANQMAIKLANRGRVRRWSITVLYGIFVV